MLSATGLVANSTAICGRAVVTIVASRVCGDQGAGDDQRDELGFLHAHNDTAGASFCGGKQLQGNKPATSPALRWGARSAPIEEGRNAKSLIPQSCDVAETKTT